MKIKAYAIKVKHGKAEPFFYTRSIGKNEALVRITHCAIARGDIQIINNDWGDTKFPVVPGHEIIGVVEGLGSEVSGAQSIEKIYLEVDFYGFLVWEGLGLKLRKMAKDDVFGYSVTYRSIL